MGYARTRLEEATERVKELEVERDALKAKLEEAQRACVEMRDILTRLRDSAKTNSPIPWMTVCDSIDEALQALGKEGKHANL